MNIAIIDDSELISQMMTTALKPYGHIPYRIKSSELKDLIPKSHQIIIIGPSIYSQDQGELIQNLRKSDRSIPIIGIIPKGDWKDRVKLFEAGADDVLNFPFPIKELMVRVENLLDRPRDKKEKRYNIKDIIVDTSAKCVKYQDRELELRRKEYSILEYLVRNRGRTVSRSELMDHIWDYRKITGSNTVDVHISNIRRKLSNKEIIRTVHGFGYKIDDPKESSIIKSK